MTERRASRLAATTTTTVGALGTAGALAIQPPPEGAGFFPLIALAGIAALIHLNRKA